MDDMRDEVGRASALARHLANVAGDLRRTGRLREILSPFCHEFRNDLNNLKMSLFLSRRAMPADAPEAEIWRTVQAAYDDLERLVERVHQLCGGTSLVPVVLPLGLLFEEKQKDWENALEVRGRRLTLETPRAPVVGAFDPARLGAALDDVFAWRLEAASTGSDLTVGWGSEGGTLSVTWSERVVDRKRKSATPGPAPGRQTSLARALATLSLPLLVRTVALHGGGVETSDKEGWQLRAWWPSAPAVTLENRHVDERRHSADAHRLVAERPVCSPG